MPRIFEKSIDRFYPNLDECCVEELLRTHILSNNGTYLYPVKLLTQIRWEDQVSPNNPYRSGDDVCLSDAEYERLRSHSSITQSIFSAKEKISFQKAQTILERSLNAKTYEGCEKNSLNFRMMSYVYGGRSLPISLIECLQNLPEHEADELLLKTLADANFTQDLDFLRSFILDLSPRQQLISINHTRSSVIKRIPAFLNALCDLPEDNRREKIKSLLTMFIGNALHLRVLLKHAASDQRIYICELMSPVFLDFIKNSSDLHNFFEYLSVKERLTAYERVRARGLSFFKNTDEHNAFLIRFQLRNDSQVMASAMMLPQSSEVISSFEDLMKIWISLRLEERIEFYKKIKPLLPTLIETGLDFMKLCLYATPELCKEIYICMKPYLSNLLKDNYLNFQWIFECLTEAQRSEAYDEIKNILPDLIKSSVAFKKVFTYLTQQQRVEILEKLENKLSDIFISLDQQNDYLHMFELSPPESFQEALSQSKLRHKC